VVEPYKFLIQTGKGLAVSEFIVPDGGGGGGGEGGQQFPLMLNATATKQIK